MTVARRARQDWQKEARRQELLNAAEGLFLEGDGSLPSVAAVAKAAGLAKGTVYLYFRTKEEIFLGLLEWRLLEWIADMQGALAAAPSPPDPDATVDAVCRYLFAEPSVLALASYGKSTLEHNVDMDRYVEFKRAINENLGRLGAEVHRLNPGLPREAATRLLLHSYAFVIGLWQFTSASPERREAMERAGAAAMQLDFKTEVRRGLLALWRGTAAQAAEEMS
jgi:AcrR family transcriptional regulator